MSYHLAKGPLYLGPNIETQVHPSSEAPPPASCVSLAEPHLV